MPTNITDLPPPSTSPGPEVNGRPTTILLLAPVQLLQHPILSSFNKACNAIYRQAHIDTGTLPEDLPRLPKEDSILAAVGKDADCFTYILHYVDTDEVLATVSLKRYYSVPLIDGAVPQDKTFDRMGDVPDDTQAWEVKLLCVDVASQKHGLGAFILNLGEVEASIRFQARVSAAGSSSKTAVEHLIYYLSTVKEAYYQFYLRKGYKFDYETVVPVGTLGSRKAFTIVHLSKVWTTTL